jgi:hypothetical protein
LAYRDVQDSAPQDLQEVSPTDQQSDSYSTVSFQTLPSPDPIANYSGRKMLQAFDLQSSDNDFLLLHDATSFPLPFSTPGPSSTVSLDTSYASCRPIIIARAISQTDPDKNNIWPWKPGPFAELSFERKSHAAPVPTHPELVFAQPGPTSEDVFHASTSSLFYEDYAAESSSSDPFVFPINNFNLPSAGQLPQINTTLSIPGPRFYAPLLRPVYFDSPTEDPVVSDPLEGFEPDGLDFWWKPFTRKDTDRVDTVKKIRDEWDSSVDSDGLETAEYQMAVDFEVCRDALRSTATESQTLMVDHSLSPSVAASVEHSPRFLQLVEHGQNAQKSVTPEPKKAKAAFAPAPGIFISPLRDEPISPAVQGSDDDISLKKLSSRVCPSCFLTPDTIELMFCIDIHACHTQE